MSPIRLLLLVPILLLSLEARAGLAAAALGVGEITRAAGRVMQRPADEQAHARWLVSRPALEILAPREQVRLLTGLAEQRAAPLLAASASLTLARHLPAEQARARAEGLGFVVAWAAVGPVPTVPGEALTAHRELASAPAPASDAPWVGSQEAVRWSVYPGRGAPGGTTLDPLLADGPAAVHLAARVDVEERTSAFLRLGAPGHLAASFDGRLLGTARSPHRARPDQLRAPVILEPGTHLLALTVSVDAARRGAVYARFTDRRGRPVEGLRVGPADEATPWPPWGLEEVGEVPDLLPSEALDLDGGGPEVAILRAAARRALGLSDRQPDDGDAGVLLEDLLLTPAAHDPGITDLLLVLLHLRRPEARASVLLHAASSGRDEPLWTLALADLAARRGQWVRAVELWREVRDRLGASAPRTVARVGAIILRRADRPVEAWREIEPWLDAEDAGEALLAEGAQVASAMERPDRAAPLLERLHREIPGDPGHGAAWAEALAALGRPGEAVDVLDRVAERYPDRPGYALEAARLMLTSGGAAEARARLEAIADRAGHDVDALTTAAHLQEEAGDLDAAVETWRRALDLRPGDPAIRRALERLEPDDRAAPFEGRVDEAMGAREPRDPESAFEVLLEEIHLEVGADGGHRRWQRRVLRVNRVPEDREARTSRTTFDPSRQDVRVLGARIHRGGLTIPVAARDLRQVSEAWYGLYYDKWEVAVPFDDLRRGDLVEVRYRVDGAPSEAMPGAFDHLEHLQGRLHTHDVVLTLTAPAALGLRTRLVVPDWLRDAGVELEQEAEEWPGGLVRHRVRARDVPPAPTEPSMPGLAEVGLLWQASSFGGWAELARRYEALLAPQRVVTPAMKRWVDARVEEARGPEGRVSRARLVRGIVDGVTREIRYVGLEFGIHGWQPYRTDQVWVRRFGDCKDQALLLTTLLDLAGIPARVVLLRTRGSGRVPEPLPSLALFDHAIVYLPEMGRFVDPTARFHGLGELPRDDQGAQALVLPPDPGEARLERVPSDPPERNGLEGDYTVILQGDGSARIDGVVAFRGVYAGDYRAELVDRDARAERLGKLLNLRYPGLELLNHEVSDPDDRAAPFRVRFTGEAPRVAQAVGETLQVRNPAGGEGHASRLASEATRRSPLVVGPPMRLRFRFRYVLPPGWTPREVPGARREEGRFGRWEVSWHAERGALRASTELELAVDQVAPADYPAFRAFMQGFAETIRPPLVLSREEEER